MLDETITYLFLMGLSHVEEIAKGLINAGRNINTSVAVISNGTTARQRKCVGNLGNIYTKVLDAQLVSHAIIVVGQVVTLAKDLNFFESRPLFGKRYIVPYIERFCFTYDKGIIPARRQEHFDSELEMKLREMGADVCSIKVGAIVPVDIQLDVFIKSLKSDWIVFTSQNGVNAFLWNLKKKGLDSRAISSAKLAVVGTKTGEALAKAALQGDLTPEKQTGRELCKCIINEIEKNSSDSEDVSITLFAAKESNKEIESLLGDRCKFEKIVCYENSDNIERNVQFEDIDWKSFDGIFFTSGSSVKRFIKISDGVLPNDIYSIGPKCSEVISKETGRLFIEAENSNYEGLLKLLS